MASPQPPDFSLRAAVMRAPVLIPSNAQENLSKMEGREVRLMEKLRLVPSGERELGAAVEIAVPDAVQARAEEIVRLSRRLGDRGAGFKSSREVLAPALVYGLAHMQERYSQAALRVEGRGEELGAREA